MDALDESLNELRAQLLACQLDACCAFQLPLVTPAEELMEPRRIESIPLSGGPAFKAALDAFTRFHTGMELSTRVVFRLPGAVAVSSLCPEHLIDQVQDINQLKKTFNTLAQTVRDPDERFDLIHLNFPGVVFLQVIRELKIVSEPLRSVTFSWGHKPASQVISLESADAKLEWAAKYPSTEMLVRTGFTLNQLQQTIARERSFLASLPSETSLRYRRKLRVRPLANLLYAEGAKVPKAQRDAHSPLIAINSPNVSLGRLKNYDATKNRQRKRRKDPRACGTPVSRVLPIFIV
nr:DNA replication terminus site-binding protein [Marinobacter sp. S6332]